MAIAAELVALLHEALLDAWALLQPVDCLGCGRADRALCPACRRAIRPVAARPVRCDAPVGVPVWVAADYAGTIRAAVLALKEHGRADAARTLGPILLVAVRAAATHAVGGSLELARVPTTRRALLRRGLDPIGELLRAVGLRESRVLRPVRTWRAGAQKARDRRGRLAADRGRFRARGRLEGRAFLLVDDVVTTGATLLAAVRAIEAGGGRVLACAALAAPELDRRGWPEQARWSSLGIASASAESSTPGS